jgi:hypothetical protein
MNLRKEIRKTIREQGLEPRLPSYDLDFLPELILQTAVDGLYKMLPSELKREYSKFWTMKPGVTIVGKSAFITVIDDNGKEHSYKIQLTKNS